MALRCSSWRGRVGSVCILLLTIALHELLNPAQLVEAKYLYVGAGFVPGSLWTNSPGADTNATLLAQQYADWAKSVSVSVGDTLVFTYDDLHSVILLPTEEAFNACNYKVAGAVTVSRAGSNPPTYYNVINSQPLYFMCSVDGHCSQGQKVAITSIGGVSSNTSLAPESSTPGGEPTRRPGLGVFAFVISASLLWTLLVNIRS